MASTRLPLALAALLLSPAVATAAPLLDVALTDSASFSVSLGGTKWLGSAPVRLFAGGAWQTLTKTGAKHSAGSDTLGAFSCVNVSWASASGLVLHTSLKSYADRDLAVFVQQLPSGAAGTNASNPVLPGNVRIMDPGAYPPIVSFPSFAGGLLESLGFVTWQSRMINAEYGTSVLEDASNATNEPIISGRGLQGLSTSGPVVLFDSSGEMNSLVVAPMDNFKTAVHTVHAGATWETGVSTELTSLPAGFEHRTMLIARRGITAAMDAFGTALRTVYGTNHSAVFDRNIEYLSYWTDNGAYYSGGAWANNSHNADENGGGNPVNETSFMAVAAGLKEQGLLDAVKVWQLDDWWYESSVPQGGVYSACVKNWSLPEQTFPSGLKKLSEALETPWLLYVPFWCPENVYSDQFRWVESYNPDFPTLIFAEPHPDDSLAFYRMLFDYGMSVGMVGFENDYLDYNFLSIPHLRKNHGAANKWLAGINQAALERKLPVQICMALPSDAMASVQFDSMTNVRSSTDYGIDDGRGDTPVQPGGIFGDSNYNIGGSSILAWALDLRPSKDIFWTHRPANCHNENVSRTAPQECGRWGAHTNPGSDCELNAIVATLSTGPVSIADKAGDTNATIVRRCVRKDGRILQPDKPATAVDSMFLQPTAADGADGTALHGGRTPPTGQVWTTHAIVDEMTWHYLLSIEVSAPWKIHSRDLYPMMPDTAAAVETDGWVAHPWFTGHSPTACAHGSHALASGCVVAAVKTAAQIPALHNTRPIMVQNDTKSFDLLTLAPVSSAGWVLLGEVGRYVRVSSDRFDDVTFSAAGVHASLSGSQGETIEVTALQPLAGKAEWLVQVKTVTFAGDTATVEFTHK